MREGGRIERDDNDETGGSDERMLPISHMLTMCSVLQPL